MSKENKESKVDIYSFIASEEIREYFRKNREFSIQEKMRIILTSWKPFTEKMEAISILKTETNGNDYKFVVCIEAIYKDAYERICNPKGTVIFCARSLWRKADEPDLLSLAHASCTYGCTYHEALADWSGYTYPVVLDINWYMESKYWPVILTIVNLWKGFGYNSIIYYATVIGIDSSLYEAAVVDGASKWQRIKNVTLPGLKPTIITMTLLAVGRVFYSDFGLFYQVPQDSGLLYDVTTTIDVYVYKGLLVLNDVGRSAAASFFQAICGFIIVLLANLIVKKIDEDSALF